MFPFAFCVWFCVYLLYCIYVCIQMCMYVCEGEKKVMTWWITKEATWFIRSINDIFDAHISGPTLLPAPKTMSPVDQHNVFGYINDLVHLLITHQDDILNDEDMVCGISISQQSSLCFLNHFNVSPSPMHTTHLDTI